MERRMINMRISRIEELQKIHLKIKEVENSYSQNELENYEKRKGLLAYLKEYKKRRINIENNQMTTLEYFGITG